MEEPIYIKHETSFASVCWLATGLAAGAALMYFLDPENGRRRRELMRDQALQAKGRLADKASGTARELKDRAYGLYAEARSRAGRPIEKAGSPESVT